MTEVAVMTKNREGKETSSVTTKCIGDINTTGRAKEKGGGEVFELVCSILTSNQQPLQSRPRKRVTMADVVQYRLERMVDELDDLERKGIFTRAETAEIVKQRRKLGYQLKRQSPLKEDFIVYIDYEVQLDELRKLRKKAATSLQAKKRKKKSVLDFAGVARIIEIYRFAIMRYKGNINLWIKYLEFCRQTKNGRMKKALARVIKFHLKVAKVWIYAANWELDRNLNVTVSLIFMHNGLRVCLNSEDLWAEYLRMKLTYINKLKARRVALREDKGSLVRDKKTSEDEEWKNKNQGLLMSQYEKERSEKEENYDYTVEDVEDVTEKVDVFLEKGSNILQAIYCGAVKTLPTGFYLRKHSLEIVNATDEIHNTILSNLKRVFSKDPEYWNWLARHEMIGCDNKETCIEFTNPQVQKGIQVSEYEDENNNDDIKEKGVQILRKHEVVMTEREETKSKFTFQSKKNPTVFKREAVPDMKFQHCCELLNLH